MAALNNRTAIRLVTPSALRKLLLEPGTHTGYMDARAGRPPNAEGRPRMYQVRYEAGRLFFFEVKADTGRAPLWREWNRVPPTLISYLISRPSPVVPATYSNRPK